MVTSDLGAVFAPGLALVIVAKLGGDAGVLVALSCGGRRPGAVGQRIAFHSARRWVPSSS